MQSAFRKYVKYKYPNPTHKSVVASSEEYKGINKIWNALKAQINQNRPMTFAVDSSGDGNTDHEVTVIGYASYDGKKYYCLYNTWDKKEHWYRFRSPPPSEGYHWGVWYADSYSIKWW